MQRSSMMDGHFRNRRLPLVHRRVDSILMDAGLPSINAERLAVLSRDDRVLTLNETYPPKIKREESTAVYAKSMYIAMQSAKSVPKARTHVIKGVCSHIPAWRSTMLQQKLPAHVVTGVDSQGRPEAINATEPQSNDLALLIVAAQTAAGFH
jgi:hypothetical protein